MRFNEVVGGGVVVGTVVSGSIAVVSLDGVITSATLALAKGAVLGALVQAGPVLGFLVHFDRATVQCTASELTAIFDGESAADQATTPAAMMVREEQMALFQAHVWQCAWRGIVRQAFTDVAKALHWLKERAETEAQTRAGQ